ncbi:hypothetical protein ACFLZ8_00855 [Planctomycetota bacterium]
MFKDRLIYWIMEYIFGGILVFVPLTMVFVNRALWTDAYIWAAQLFVVCLGVILVSCASSMRQRILLSRRIDKLAEQITDNTKSS